MTLLDDLKKLREMEQKEPRWVDEHGCAAAVDVEYLNALYQNAPTMLFVLECFREGDADILDDLLSDWVYSERHPAVEVLRRLQKATAMVEGKGDGFL